MTPMPPHPRVLLVLGTSAGGIGRHVHSIVAGLTQREVPVAVAGPQSTEDTFGFTRAGAVFFAIEIAADPHPMRDLRATHTLSSAAIGWRAGVVHAHGLRAGAMAALALRARRPGTPRARLIVTWHNANLATGARARVHAGLEQLAARGADLTLGASADLVERARRSGARDARLGEVAAPPLLAPTRAPGQIRGALQLPAGPVLLAVGRLATQKDYPTMLAAARVWAAREPAPTLLVAGDGPLAADLACAGANLPVRWLGARSDVADLLSIADVVVLSSRWEARALIAQEALRAGVPLVATAVGGVPDLVGDAALLVPAGDVMALATAVNRILDDPALAAGLRAAGPVRAATWPDERAMLAALLAGYTGGNR
ncbi:MAG: glycosyltransferase family 4 protein [Sporichthyaceae bacterium]